MIVMTKMQDLMKKILHLKDYAEISQTELSCSGPRSLKMVTGGIGFAVTTTFDNDALIKIAEVLSYQIFLTTASFNSGALKVLQVIERLRTT
jgi:hypothetical protein